MSEVTAPTPSDRDLDAIGWVKAGDIWYMTTRRDTGMQAHNLDNVEEVLKRGGKLGTTVDIGAHVGFTALPCASLGATVWAFEANPWAFGCLVAGALRSGLASRLRPFQAAVAGGPRRLADIRSPVLVRGMAGLVQAHDQPVVGRAVTLDFETVLASTGFIDFLKLDIEGGEHELLPSVPKGAWQEVDWFHLETHDIEQARWHAPGAKNIDWEALVRGVGFERLTPALWRMKRVVSVPVEASIAGDGTLERAA